MKRILAWVLVLVMALGLFAGCKKQEEAPATTQPVQEEVISANDAMAYLKALYPKTEEAQKTPINYERPGIIRVGGIPFTIVWSTDLPEEQIKIIVSEDGATVTIDVNEQCEADTPYVLTATITDEQGNTATATWDCILPEAVDMVSIVKEAYALKKGESLPYECTLRGKITNINTAWNPEYKNITVTIAVEGAEDMPIECYRLKGEGAEKLQVGNIITVTGTLKNYEGKIEFDSGCVLDAVEQGDAVEALTDVGEILKAAYKLKDGKSLGYSVELTGVVTTIDNPYDPGYKNISVVIEMEGYSKYPILCYRLKGEEAENIAIGDTITVTGLIKNYKGTIEFDAGCQLLKRVSGGGVAQKPSDDEDKILKDAKKLGTDEKLPYVATLTGQVFSIDEKYSSQYDNITVTMKVSGTRIKCFHMKGDGVSKIKVGDTITVTGTIVNYKGETLEFSPATLTDRKAGNGKIKVELGPVSEDQVYYAEMKQATLGKNLYFNGKISNSGYLQTSDNSANAVKINVEEVSGKGTRFYFDNNGTKTYIELKEMEVNGEAKQRAALVTEPTAYWNYDSELKVYFFDVNGVYCALGTYSNYDTISATKLGFLSTKNIGKSQFVVKYVTEPSTPPEGPSAPAGDGTIASALAGEEGETFTVTGVVTLVDGKNLYLQDATGAICVRFDENIDGFQLGHVIKATGVKALYNTMPQLGSASYEVASGIELVAKETTIGALGTKDICTYVSIKGVTVTEVYDNNGAYTSPNITVKDSEGKTIQLYKAVVNKNGSNWAVKVGDKLNVLAAVGVHNNKLQLRNTYATEIAIDPAQAELHVPTAPAPVPETPEEPEQPPVNPPATGSQVVTAPVAGTAYKLGMDIGDSILYVDGGTGSKTYYLSTVTDTAAAVDVYLEEVTGGYLLYFMKGDAKTYIRVSEYQDGDAGYGKGTLELTTTKPSEYYTFDTAANTLVYTAADGENSYYMGTYFSTSANKIYDTVSTSNLSFITGANADKIGQSQFPLCLYTVSAGGTTPEQPPVNPPATGSQVVTAPVAGTAYKLGMDIGDSILYVDGGTGSKTYYLSTVTDTAAAVDVYLEEVTGGYLLYFMKGDAKTYIRVSEYQDGDAGYGKGTLELTTTKPSEYYTFDTAANTLVFTAADGENAYYMGTYFSTSANKIYDTVSTSNLSFITGANADKIGQSQFPLCLYTVSAGGTTPEQPPVNPPATGSQVVTAPVAGTAYKLGMDIGDSILYVDGGTGSKTYYLSTVTDTAAAVDVYLEEVTGGYLLYFMKGDAKTYIRVSEYQDGDPGYGKGTLELTTTKPSEYYTFDTAANTLVYTAADGENAYYMGTYFSSSANKIYDTVSTSNLSFITGDNASKIGQSQFPLCLYTVSAGGTTPEQPPVNPPATGSQVVTAPVAGTAYKLGMDIGDSILYVDGGTGSKTYYLSTVTDTAAAVDVYLEEVTGGYLLYFMKGDAKTYIRVSEYQDGDAGYGKGTLELTTTKPSEYYTFDTAANTLVFTAADGENAYYMGTYFSSSANKIYDTVSTSNISFITGDNASKIGQSQFPLCLYTVSAGGTTPEQPPVNPPAGNDLAIEEAIAMGTPMAQDTFTTEKYKVTGVIDEIYSTQYGNMYIKDAAGNRLKIYGTWDATGATRYDALSVKPVVGDTVILLGVIGNFNGAQMKDGWIIEHLPSGNPAPNPDPEVPAGNGKTITFDDIAKRTALSDEQQVWVENGITVTNDRATSTAKINGTYYNPLRLYKSTSVTVACTDMVKLEVKCTSSDYRDTLESTLSALSGEGITVSTNGNTVIIELAAPADSVNITMTVGQVRVQSITVYTAE